MDETGVPRYSGGRLNNGGTIPGSGYLLGKGIGGQGPALGGQPAGGVTKSPAIEPCAKMEGVRQAVASVSMVVMSIFIVV